MPDAELIWKKREIKIKFDNSVKINSGLGTPVISYLLSHVNMQRDSK